MIGSYAYGGSIKININAWERLVKHSSPGTILGSQ